VESEDREKDRLSSLYCHHYTLSTVFGLVQILHQNALSYPCDSTNAKMRTQNHAHIIQVLCNFHFLLSFYSLSLSFSLFLFSMRYFSLTCTVLLLFTYTLFKTHTCSLSHARSLRIRLEILPE